jgi:energy-coupling factor transport system permease protein
MLHPGRLPWNRHLARATPWHRTDPRVRLLATLVLSGLALVSRSAAPMCVVYLLLAAIYCLSRTGWKTAWAGFRPFLFLLAFTFLLQVVFTPGRPPAALESFPFFPSREGLLLSLTIFLRLAALILVSTHLIATTSPLELSRSLGWVISPASRFGLPVADLILILNLGFQFFPIIVEESQNLRLALESRGISLRHPRVSMRFRALTAWILALLVSVLERSHRLALALEVKGFRGGGPARLRFPRWRGESTLGLAATAASIAAWVSTTL